MRTTKERVLGYYEVQGHLLFAGYKRFQWRLSEFIVVPRTSRYAEVAVHAQDKATVHSHSAPSERFLRMAENKSRLWGMILIPNLKSNDLVLSDIERFVKDVTN